MTTYKVNIKKLLINYGKNITNHLPQPDAGVVNADHISREHGPEDDVECRIFVHVRSLSIWFLYNACLIGSWLSWVSTY